MEQMSLPITCEKCEAETVDNCICDWKMAKPDPVPPENMYDDLKEFLDKEIIYGN